MSPNRELKLDALTVFACICISLESGIFKDWIKLHRNHEIKMNLKRVKKSIMDFFSARKTQLISITRRSPHGRVPRRTMDGFRVVLVCVLCGFSDVLETDRDWSTLIIE